MNQEPPMTQRFRQRTVWFRVFRTTCVHLLMIQTKVDIEHIQVQVHWPAYINERLICNCVVSFHFLMSYDPRSLGSLYIIKWGQPLNTCVSVSGWVIKHNSSFVHSSSCFTPSGLVFNTIYTSDPTLTKWYDWVHALFVYK